MKQLTGITTDAKQTFTLVLDNGGQASLYMEYIDGQQGWFYTITYGSFIQTFRRLVVSGNMLRNFRNIIPFGIACQTTDLYEDIFINDFANNRAQLFILNQEDVAKFESILNVN